jgi:hypothetical protein
MTHSLRLCALALVASLGACSPPADEEDVATAVLSLVQVPADIHCVRITAAGSRTVVKSFDATPGASATFSLSRLPVGAVTFSGEAFAAACSAVGMSAPDWVSDPVTVTLTAGIEAQVSLIMRRNGRASVSVDFVDDCPAAKLCFAATLVGANEVPPVMTAATGFVSVVFDPATSGITLHLTHNIMDATAAHIHGPAAVGTNAPVVVNIGPGLDSIIMAPLTPALSMALQAGLLYVNVHSPANPGGQIRGQLAAVP